MSHLIIIILQLLNFKKREVKSTKGFQQCKNMEKMRNQDQTQQLNAYKNTEICDLSICNVLLSLCNLQNKTIIKLYVFTEIFPKQLSHEPWYLICSLG